MSYNVLCCVGGETFFTVAEEGGLCGPVLPPCGRNRDCTDTAQYLQQHRTQFPQN